jgi:hypothetical protein
MQGTFRLARYFTLSLLLIVLIFVSGCLKTGEDYTRLNIESVDIMADQVKSSYIDFNITSYVENFGDTAAGNVSILLKAYNSQSNLLEKQIKIRIGKIDAKKTTGISLPLRLPRKGSYQIQIILYDGDVRKTSEWEGISNVESLQPEVRDIDLEIGEIDFLVRNASNGKAVIENDIYTTNEGADNSSEFSVLVKAREMDARLIADKKWTMLKPIPPETTVIKSVNLTVPDQYNYVIEILIWSNGTVIKRGEGNVLLRPGTKLEEGEHIESKSIDTGGFETAAEAPSEAQESWAEERMAQPGFGILIALASVAAVAMRRRRLV